LHVQFAMDGQQDENNFIIHDQLIIFLLYFFLIKLL